MVVGCSLGFSVRASLTAYEGQARCLIALGKPADAQRVLESVVPFLKATVPAVAWCLVTVVLAT
jgi:hypothetical protein